MRRRILMKGAISAMQIGQSTPIPNILNLFYALENGTAKTGEFLFEAPLSSGEHLIFDSGLDEINGIMIADADWDSSNTTTTLEYTAFGLYIKNPNREQPVIVMLNNAVNNGKNVVRNDDFLSRARTRIEGGLLYATPDFGNNPSYTAFRPNHKYIWVAW